MVDNSDRMRERLLTILGRHIRPLDEDLSDRDFVKAVIKRHEKSLEQYLIDPNE